MAESTQPVVKKRRLGRKLAWVGGSLALLLVIVYFVATSAAFLKGVVLPRVSTIIHATVTVDDATLSPFSSVSLRGLKVVTTGTEPLLQATEVRTGYSLTGMMGGNINVNEVTIVAPVVNIVQNADGTRNLDPLFISDKKEASDKKKTPKAAKIPQLDIRNVTLQNATVRLVRNLKGGGRQVIELANVNISLDQLRNAASGKLSIAADAKIEGGAVSGAASNDVAQAKIAASFDLAMTADLVPQSIKARAQLDVSRGQGAFKGLVGFGATLDCDLTMTDLKQLLDLRQFQLTLTPTARAKNVLQLAGKLDLTKANAITGSVKLTGESLDLTPYYDLFDDPSQKKSPAKTTAAGPMEADANTEPEAVVLPLRQFTLDAGIGRLYLRDIAVANFVAAAKIDGGRVSVKPLQFSINGAPINASADLNLGVPGYQYDVALKADKVPVEPIANSFSPVYKGQANGDVFANLKVTGTGVTGESLRKNLNGQIALSFTNANIKLVGPKIKAILTPIALVLNIPELFKSPLNYISADLGLGNGNIEVRRFIAHSDAFIGESTGRIPIAEVFTNSPLHQPIEISLPRSLAKKFTITGAAPTASYVKLPNFVKLEGTLGNPKAKTDKLVISGMVASGVAGAVGGKAGGILGEVGGILTGQPASTNTQTNQTANPKPNKVSPLDLLKLIPKKK